MTTIDYAIIEQDVAELDSEPFEKAAAWTAETLRINRYAYVVLEPGDATAYRIMFIAPGGHMWSTTHGELVGDHRYYHVALSFGLGLGYDWPGYETDPSYVFEKWTRYETGSDYHTACVLTRFLNTLAPLIASPS